MLAAEKDGRPQVELALYRTYDIAEIVLKWAQQTIHGAEVSKVVNLLLPFKKSPKLLLLRARGDRGKT